MRDMARPRPSPARLLTAVTVVALTLAGCSGLPGRGRPEPSGAVVIATGGTKGVYYGYGATLAGELRRQAPRLDPSVLPTTGSIENLRLLADGQVTMAFVAGDAATLAYEGRPPFPTPVPIRALARVYDDYVHLVARSNGPIRAVRDLAGRRVSLGPVGSGTALIAERVLAVAGVPVRGVRDARLGINESVAALQAGQIDAFFWSGGLPTAGVEELATSVPVRLVALGDLAERMRERFGPSYRPATVPAGIYRLAERAATIAVPNMLVCRADADAALVERVTSTLFAARETLTRTVPQANALDQRAAIATFPVPLHEGAQRHYRAVKV
jgi:hypothetical protein